MTKEALIQNTLKTLSKLPKKKVKEIADFADSLLKHQEEDTLQTGIQKLVSNSETFDFINDEEVLYTTNDLKVKF